jgi:NCAIR mutase (PurE)-related protein
VTRRMLKICSEGIGSVDCSNAFPGAVGAARMRA